MKRLALYTRAGLCIMSGIGSKRGNKQTPDK